MKTIGDRVRESREAKKYTKKKLALAIGVEPSTIGHIESGHTKQPLPSTLYAIAAELDVDPGEIVSGESGRRPDFLSQHIRGLAERMQALSKPDLETIEAIICMAEKAKTEDSNLHKKVGEAGK